MNICMFTNTYLPHVGGVARSVSTFADDLHALGHKVMIIAPTFEEQPDEKDKPNVLRVAAIQNFNGSDFSVRIPLPGIIEEDISDFKPDIIHSHHPFLLGDAALRTARRLDLPILFTHHTLYEQYTHYIPFDSGAMKRFVIQLATEYANLCSHVIAPSTSIRKLLLKRGVTKPVTVLPTGIDLEFFQKGDGKSFRDAYQIHENRKIIGHVGRLAREKNLPYLATAVSRFLQQHENFLFVVAGTGDAEADIEKIFVSAGLADRLVRPGIMKNSGLADCYTAMDLFVFASKSETQGLVLMEAMAAGVPVIALRASGVNDVVENDKNGLILKADSTESSFAAAIAEAFSSDAIDRWRPETLKTAQGFSRRRCALKLLDLYRTTISKNSHPDHHSDTLETIVKKLRMEWDLLQEKASALKEGFASSADENTS